MRSSQALFRVSLSKLRLSQTCSKKLSCSPRLLVSTQEDAALPSPEVSSIFSFRLPGFWRAFSALVSFNGLHGLGKLVAKRPLKPQILLHRNCNFCYHHLFLLSASLRVMSSIGAQLSAIAANGDQKVKIQLYKDLLAKIVETPKVPDFKAFVDHSTCLKFSFFLSI